MATGVGRMTNYGKPPKDKKASIKITQPILIDWELAKTLVECKAMKAPTVPKMEALEKWVLARGWDILIEHDKASGLTVSTIVVPGMGTEQSIHFQGSDATMALATAKAVGDAYRNGPRQSSFVDGPDGDLPEDQQAVLIKDGPIDRQTLEDMGSLKTMIETDRDAGGYDLDPAPNLADDWRFLYIVDPADMKAWHAKAPADDEGIAYVEAEDGDSEHRGWHIDPAYDYDHKLGTITERESKQIVWSRDHPAGVVQPDPPKDRKKAKRTPEEIDRLSAEIAEGIASELDAEIRSRSDSVADASVSV